jgi:hypothetical protein
MRIVLFVEGFTEREAVAAFLKRWLDPRLARPVRITPVRFNGWRDLFDGAATKARLYLDRRNEDVLGVIALFDLYGPTIYSPELDSADRRYEWIVRHLERQVGHPRFRAFAAVHEVEAWLLSQPELLPAPVRNGLPGRCERPETVNFDEPPAKLLDRLYSTHLHRGYKKRTYGRDLFGRLDPDRARERCPRLASLLDAMLELAQQTQP